MTVRQLCEAASLTVFTADSEDREIVSGYCGDFLSNVIGRAPESCAWLTVMNNANVAAVAALTECACVILCEGVRPDGSLLERARTQKINLLGSAQDAYRTAHTVHSLCGV